MASPTESIAPQRTRVLIVTDDVAASSPMINSLRREGLDVQMTAFDGRNLSATPLHAPAAILCFLSEFSHQSEFVVSLLKHHYAPKEIPVIGRIDRGTVKIEPEDLPFESTLFAPVHPVQVAHRISAIIRLGRMEREIIRRLETISEDFGQSVALRSDQLDRPFRILFVGKPSPAYMAVIHSLQGRNVEVVAAFTSFSAFDYLHDNRFDAVVMNALDGPEPALTIAHTMQRNPRLFHVPTLFLIDDGAFTDRREAFEAGARDLIDIAAPSEDISNRIIELANYHRLHDGLKSEFTGIGGATYCDAETGIFNAKFLTRHLPRVVDACRRNAQPLTVLALKLLPRSHDHVDKVDLENAYSKAIKIIGNLVRMQDIVARVEDDTLLIAFPEETRSAIETVLERMSGLIECAAFETRKEDTPPLSMDLETEIVERSSDEDAATLIRFALDRVGCQNPPMRGEVRSDFAS